MGEGEGEGGVRVRVEGGVKCEGPGQGAHLLGLGLGWWLEPEHTVLRAAVPSQHHEKSSLAGSVCHAPWLGLGSGQGWG